MTNVANIPLQNAYETTLENSMDSTQLTMTVADGPDFALPAGQGVYAVIDPKNSFREVVLITGITGTVLTVTRGQTDYSGGASTAQEHSGGAKVIITDSYHIFSEYATAINSKLNNDGGNATTAFNLGVTGTDWRLRRDGNDMKFRDNNQAEVTLSALASGAGVNDKTKVSVADTTEGYLGSKLVSATGGIDFNILNPGANETLNLTVDLSEVDITAGPLANICSDVTSTAAEVNKLSGASANVTAANLNTLTAGPLSDATAFHTHTSTAQVATGIAGETITVGQALAEIPYDVRWYTQLVDADLALGDANARRRQALKIIPAKTITGITSMQFRGREINGGSTTTVTFSIQTDNAGVPSGIVIANGTANAIDPSGWTATYNSRTATFAASPTLVKGTVYWLVWETSTTDPAQGLYIGVNSTYDENYCTFTRLTYDLDAATWGGSVTNAAPFFWFYTTADTPLGSKLVVTDANFGRRTWNFVGMASAGYSAEATVTYYYEIVPASILPSAIEAGVDYYVSETAGGISKDIPNGLYGQNFAYKIGRGAMNSAGTVDLKIDKGEKKILIREGTEITATTTRQYILWFKPKTVEIIAGQGAGGSTVSFSHGFYDGTNNYVLSNSGEVFGINTDRSLYVAMGGNTFSGVGSAVTDIGFAYVYTEGTAAGVYAILDCTA